MKTFPVQHRAGFPTAHAPDGRRSGGRPCNRYLFKLADVGMSMWLAHAPRRFVGQGLSRHWNLDTGILLAHTPFLL